MKKQIVSFLVLVASPLKAAEMSTSATVSTREAVSLGLQGGASFYDASAPTDISTSTRTGFMGGVNLELPVSSLLSVQPEMLYVQRGARLLDVGGAEVSAITDSIEVPVLVRVNFGSVVRPYVFAGPAAVFNVANRLAASVGGDTGGVSYNPRTVDLAGTVGAGVEFQNLFVNLRYSVGLLGNDASSSNWQSRGFQLLGGVNLDVM